MHKLGYLYKYWRKHRGMFILGVLLVVMEAICDLLQPRFMSMLVDEGAMRGDMPNVLRYGSIMLGIAITGLGFAFGRNYIATHVAQRLAAELRFDMFSKIQSMSAYEIDSFEEGSLITRQTNDIAQLSNFVGGLMRVVVRAPVICIGAIFMAISLNLRSMPVIIPIVAACAVIITMCMKLAYPRYTKVQIALDKLNSVVREYLAGIRLVKAFRRFKDEEVRFSRANDALTDTTVEAGRVLAVLSPFMALFVNMGIAAVLWLGARWVDYGDMQVGQVMAFLSYMTQILMSINIISNILNIFVRVQASHKRIAEVMENGELRIENGELTVYKKSKANEQESFQKPELSIIKAPRSGAFPNSSINPDNLPHLEFINVGLAYKGNTGEPALTGINFTLKRGETLGIIGPTGSGKSSLASLLLRFYEPTAGQILLGGTPISELDEARLRSRIAIVPQVPTLFTGTIRENIAWGKQDAAQIEIERAANDAQALEFITASDEGYKRRIGQGGLGLSGGQKQRISIARALIRNPELLILDDCTSALDVLTEAAVKDALGKYNMTTLFITQRIMTVRKCDKILVLENGNMAGFGTHSRLIKTCSVYRDICRSQE